MHFGRYRFATTVIDLPELSTGMSVMRGSRLSSEHVPWEGFWERVTVWDCDLLMSPGDEQPFPALQHHRNRCRAESGRGHGALHYRGRSRHIAALLSHISDSPSVIRIVPKKGEVRSELGFLSARWISPSRFGKVSLRGLWDIQPGAISGTSTRSAGVIPPSGPMTIQWCWRELLSTTGTKPRNSIVLGRV